MARTLESSAYSGTFDSALKQFYDGTMQSLIPNLFPLVQWLSKEGRVRKVKPQGSKIYFATEYKYGKGAGARGEGDYLPGADQVYTVQGNVPYKKGIKGRIQLSSEAMKFGKEGVGAFVNVMKQEMTGNMNLFKHHAAPYLWGFGDGMLARVNGTGGATITVDSNEVYDANEPGTRWLHEGLSFISCDGLTNYVVDSNMTAAVTVSSITSDTVFVPSASQTITNNYYLVEHQCTDISSTTEHTKGSVTLSASGETTGAGSFRGPQGMLALVDDGTTTSSYCGISESTYPQWKGVMSHNSGTARSLTLDLFYRLFFKMTRKAGTFSPKLTCWMNTDVYRTLVDLLEHFIEFAPRSLKPGFEEFDLMVKGVKIPIRLDHYCPSHIFFLNPSKITFAQGCAPEVARETGSMWRFVSDKDMYEAVTRWIFNTYTRNRNMHGILSDLDITIASV